MTTFPSTFALCEPVPGEAVPSAVFEYLNTRNKMKAFTRVQEEFRKSGLTQAELATRLGKRADRVSRVLNAPGNWELDTLSEFLFAISGATVRYEVDYPLRKVRPNPLVVSSASGGDTPATTVEPSQFYFALPDAKLMVEASSIPANDDQSSVRSITLPMSEGTQTYVLSVGYAGG